MGTDRAFRTPASVAETAVLEEAACVKASGTAEPDLREREKTERADMITISEAYASARGAVFRMPIEPGSGGQWWWGTGFFISSTGHALPALPNLPANMAPARRGQGQGLDA